VTESDAIVAAWQAENIPVMYLAYPERARVPETTQ
jgi:hypothetical protein